MIQVRVSEVCTNPKAKALFCLLLGAVDLALTEDSGGFRPVLLPPSAIVKLVGENQHLDRLGHFQVIYSTTFQAEDDRGNYSGLCFILLNFV